MIQLTEHGTEKKVWVNFSSISMLKPYGNCTRVIFTNGTEIKVTEQAHDIVKMV